MLIQAAGADLLNASTLIFPALECFHIIGFALLIGSIAMVDFRMLGLGLVRQEPAELSKGLAIWTHLGLLFILFSGPLMYSTDPDMYYLNWSFLIKMACLVAALAFHFTIHRKAVRQPAAGSSKAVACTSLVLWASVIFGGIFIGFVTQGL
jgi:hypothetical protein